MAVFLLDPPENEQEQKEVCAVPAPLIECRVEAAGWSFERWHREAILGQAAEEEGKGGKATQKAKKMEDRDMESEKKVKTKKLREEELEQDHYEILGLSAVKWSASDDDVKLAYKQKALDTHPDKTGGDDGPFKRVQLAFEVLADKAKRRAFDSSLEFDDSIPSALKLEPKDFFRVFGNAFAANSRWSTAKKVPQLGDADTPYDDVDSFYQFWNNFQSWRDFSEADEHDPETAECREERRWMEKENERGRVKARKDENKRILTLVERAYKQDPRLKKRAMEERQAKEAKEAKLKADKEEKARLEREAEAERARKEEEEIKARKEAHMKNKERQKLRKKLIRNGCKPFVDSTYRKELDEAAVFKDDLDFFIANSSLALLDSTFEELVKICGNEKLEGFNKKHCAKAVEVLNEGIIESEKILGKDRFGVPLGVRVAGSPTSAGSKPSSPSSKNTPKKVEKELEWTEDEVSKLIKAIKKFPGGAGDRWVRIAAFIATDKTPEQVLKKTKELGGQLNTVVVEKKDAKSEPPPITAPAATDTVVEEIWTAPQQKSLEEALKELRGYKEKDKWEKIAAKVEGKTKKQCVARYKYLATMSKG